MMVIWTPLEAGVARCTIWSTDLWLLGLRQPTGRIDQLYGHLYTDGCAGACSPSASPSTRAPEGWTYR